MRRPTTLSMMYPKLVRESSLISTLANHDYNRHLNSNFYAPYICFFFCYFFFLLFPVMQISGIPLTCVGDLREMVLNCLVFLTYSNKGSCYQLSYPYTHLNRIESRSLNKFHTLSPPSFFDRKLSSIVPISNSKIQSPFLSYACT
ncbi:hypothetical protein CLIB1423_26S00606 [[Candida] railenensis]|uniref:Uncharacterized protein n=1 Tax=[Candida] railenensis TaxID=45579 RepID=A0A9P0QVJ6_9ASCO|nr:hypothetical protein CLIB1423_26S00606 [[Candida] railenensis]